MVNSFVRFNTHKLDCELMSQTQKGKPNEIDKHELILSFPFDLCIYISHDVSVTCGGKQLVFIGEHYRTKISLILQQSHMVPDK